MRGFQNGLIFQILASGSPEILRFGAPKNGFLRQDLEGTYMCRVATKRGIFDVFFTSFLRLNPPNFAKNDPNVENKDLFYAKIYGA